MRRPEFYPHSVSRIEQRETHISHVFLTGDYVYKIKKPVNLDFLDFTTLKKRYHYCHQEVILNKRLSHNVYLGVVPITFKDGNYHLTGPGIPVEYAVKMLQLPEDRSMVHLLKRKKIRDCHGDLRTGHIYFTDKGIQIIDCIEFNERFRFQDITSDLAFLAMDLDYDGFPQIANYLLDDYAKHTEDPDVFVLIDFYKCYRAFVRCKVNCIRFQEDGLGKKDKAKLFKETNKYLDFAYRYAVQFTRPTLWVVCGMPGSGKSTISRDLSRVFRIKAFQSDVIRKELYGLKPDDLSDM